MKFIFKGLGGISIRNNQYKNKAPIKGLFVYAAFSILAISDAVGL